MYKNVTLDTRIMAIPGSRCAADDAIMATIDRLVGLHEALFTNNGRAFGIITQQRLAGRKWIYAPGGYMHSLSAF